MTTEMKPDATYTKPELQEMLRKMRAASTAFYGDAVRCGHHAFIEFTGLMNEYIAICEKALAEGIDFTETTKHSGKALPMSMHHAAYLGEKFGCIFGPSLQQGDNAEVFIAAAEIAPRAKDVPPEELVRCPTCEPKPGQKNQPDGMMFVGWGHGWVTCSTCNGTMKVSAAKAALCQSP